MPFDNPLPEAETAASQIEMAMARIAGPDRWCRGVVSRVENGQLQRCALGALVVDDDGNFNWVNQDRGAMQALHTVACRRGFLHVADFNNHPHTTHADVLDAMREAVRDLRG